MNKTEEQLRCPKCNEKVWDKATVDQQLNKCWECGLRFDNRDIVKEDMK